MLIWPSHMLTGNIRIWVRAHTEGEQDFTKHYNIFDLESLKLSLQAKLSHLGIYKYTIVAIQGRTI